MKKILVLMMALVMTLSFAACGGDEGSVESEPEASVPAASDITLVSKEANYTTLLVPSDFSEFKIMDDNMALAEGTNCNILVSNTYEADISIEDVTEDYMLEMVEKSYSNVEVLAFENPVTIADVDATLFQCSGDGGTSGKNRTVCYMMLFFELEGVDCVQHVILTYDTGAGTSLEENLEEIIESITL